MDTEKWIEKGRRELKGLCDNPLFESQVLLGSVLNLSLPELYFKENSVLNLKSQREFLKKIRWRKEGCPTAYITGEKEFFKRRFFTGPGVFIPRPETEALVEIALGLFGLSGQVFEGSDPALDGSGYDGAFREGAAGFFPDKGFKGKGGALPPPLSTRAGRGVAFPGSLYRSCRSFQTSVADDCRVHHSFESGSPDTLNQELSNQTCIKEKSFRGVDFGAGGGCVALTLALENSASRFVAVESSASALPYLEKNRAEWKMERRVRILNRDVERLSLKDTADFLEGRPNIITANPPYIDPDDKDLEDSVRRFEPPQALFSGKGGLAHIYSWFSKAVELMGSGGVYVFEMGRSQGPAVKRFLDEKQELKSYKIYKDLQGFDRTAVCVKK